MQDMDKSMNQELLGDRQVVIKAAKVFGLLLNKSELSEEEIDAATEELRPLRMHIHALDYGDAPGYRES
jgi:hypothetical protein